MLGVVHSPPPPLFPQGPSSPPFPSPLSCLSHQCDAPLPPLSFDLSAPPPPSRSYINEYPTGRLLRDAKLYEIGAGTSEIRRILIGRELFKESAP